MTKMVATVLDVTSTQSYIFTSNRLRENIGASYVVARATEAWPIEVLLRMFERKVVVPDHGTGTQGASQGRFIENGDVEAELVYAGGGNTVILFANLTLARDFTRILTGKLLREVPGLSVIAAHREFEWNARGSTLASVISAIVALDLDRIKRERTPSAPLLGLSVTAACQSTGLPAVDTSDHYGVPGDPYPISRETAAKLRAVDDANASLATALSLAHVDARALPLDLDNLGRSEGTSSYVAVVHADGNGIGQRFIAATGADYASDRAYIEAMRTLSARVRGISGRALRTVFDCVRDSIDADGKVCGEFPASRRVDDAGQDRGVYFPFRPLVYGGDDVTFVCDGRLGLALAARYLTEFERESARDGDPLTACAGISVVKVHYPFTRAYALSEALCRRAKGLVRDSKKTGGGADLSALDWHLAASGVTESLAQLRQREYRVAAGQLEARPLFLGAREGTWRTWPAVRDLTRELRDGKDWRMRRNKVLALREALRRGPQATKDFLHTYRLGQLPPILGADASDSTGMIRTTGWLNSVCGYFDAIEAMEFLIDPSYGGRGTKERAAEEVTE